MKQDEMNVVQLKKNSEKDEWDLQIMSVLNVIGYIFWHLDLFVWCIFDLVVDIE